MTRRSVAVRQGPARTLLAPAVALTLLGGAACLAGGAALRGVPGLLAAAVAVVVVLGFLLAGQAPLAAATRLGGWTGGTMLVSLYLTRVLLVVVAYGVVLAAGDAVDRPVLGVSVIVCTLAWTAGTVWSALRWRPLLIDEVPAGSDGQPAPDGRDGRTG